MERRRKLGSRRLVNALIGGARSRRRPLRKHPFRLQVNMHPSVCNDRCEIGHVKASFHRLTKNLQVVKSDLVASEKDQNFSVAHCFPVHRFSQGPRQFMFGTESIVDVTDDYRATVWTVGVTDDKAFKRHRTLWQAWQDGRFQAAMYVPELFSTGTMQSVELRNHNNRSCLWNEPLAVTWTSMEHLKRQHYPTKPRELNQALQSAREIIDAVAEFFGPDFDFTKEHEVAKIGTTVIAKNMIYLGYENKVHRWAIIDFGDPEHDTDTTDTDTDMDTIEEKETSVLTTEKVKRSTSPIGIENFDFDQWDVVDGTSELSWFESSENESSENESSEDEFGNE